ncbi:hypothetical protein D3C74_95580 [compost metagenome]
MIIGVNGHDEIFSKVIPALTKLASQCKDSEGTWLLGGSCSLWLQDVSITATPNDIDVYVDMKDVEEIHAKLSGFALDEPHLDDTGLYHSCLSHYSLDELPMELVGGFEVRTEGAYYRTEVTDVLSSEAPQWKSGNIVISLMPLAHEFVFNILRNRPDRYLAIATIIRNRPAKHLPLLSKLLERNEWNAQYVGRMAEILDQPLLSGQWKECRNGHE